MKKSNIKIAAVTHNVTAKCRLTGDIKNHTKGMSKYAAKKLKNTLAANHPEYHVFLGID